MTMKEGIQVKKGEAGNRLALQVLIQIIVFPLKKGNYITCSYLSSKIDMYNPYEIDG